MTKLNVDLIYPIGSIYMSVNSTNPNIYFGGTWETWGTGRVPVGVDTSQTEFATVEKTGGSKFLQEHYHTLSKGGQGFVTSNGAYAGVCGDWGAWNTTGVQGVQTGNSGNLQPYITCYMWKRTA